MLRDFFQTEKISIGLIFLINPLVLVFLVELVKPIAPIDLIKPIGPVDWFSVFKSKFLLRLALTKVCILILNSFFGCISLMASNKQTLKLFLFLPIG